MGSDTHFKIDVDLRIFFGNNYSVVVYWRNPLFKILIFAYHNCRCTNCFLSLFIVASLQWSLFQFCDIHKQAIHYRSKFLQIHVYNKIYNIHSHKLYKYMFEKNQVHSVSFTDKRLRAPLCWLETMHLISFDSNKF